VSSTGPSRRPRSVVGFVEAIPWRTLLLDLVFVVVWVVAVSAVFEAAGWETWLYYVTAFGGVVVYSLGIGSFLSRRLR
jgi:hypothetical protein